MVNAVRLTARQHCAFFNAFLLSHWADGLRAAFRADGMINMYRVIAVLGAGIALAGCSSSSSWLDSLKPAPPTENISFESEPAGADVKTSTGQACKTPCSLAVPASAPVTVTFSLDGYLADSEQIELVAQGDGTSRLRPNPVMVELSPAPPAPAKKPARRRATTAKPRPPAAPKPAATAPAPAPAAPAPTATSPWPSTPPANR